MSSVDQSWRITEDMIAWVRSLIGVEMRPQSTYFNTQASRDTVRHFVDALADPNPLYRDESYARTTRLGTLAAPPSFLYSVYLPGGGMSNMGNWLPPGNGMDGGNDWEWFAPILEGDSFTYSEKITSVVEKHTRMWGRAYRIDSEVEFWNQRDEKVAKGSGWVFRLDPVEEPAGGRRPVQTYTNDELRRIVEGYRNETVRGAEPRYWEDVQPGDELPPAVRGPLDAQDLTAWVVGAGTSSLQAHRQVAYPDVRPDWKRSLGKAVEYTLNEPTWIERPQEREHYKSMLEHFDPAGAEQRGVGAPFDFGPQRMSWLIMLITHWQGDEGSLKRFYCELRDLNQLGDTTWLRGYVVDKTVSNGEHLVDIACRGENQLGKATIVGNATVALPSRQG